MQSSAEFVTNFVPPDYLIDGLIQRRFIYSMTGPTGEGKTSVALLLALFVDRGWSLDNRQIDKGKVLFLAGENPDDVRMRWIKLLDDMKVPADEVNVFFVPGSLALSNKGHARSITEKERDAAENTGQKNKAQLLTAMAKIPGASLADLAKEVGWTTKDGKPYRSLVQRLLSALREDKLVKKESGRGVLTKAGIKAAGTVAAQEELDMPF
jgi:AAA domain